MPENYKVLGELVPAADTLLPLYTVPAGKQAVVSTVNACNELGTATIIRLSVAVGGAADDPKQYIYYDAVLDASAPYPATIGITMGAGDVLRCRSHSGSVAFQAFGTEIS